MIAVYFSRLVFANQSPSGGMRQEEAPHTKNGAQWTEFSTTSCWRHL